MKRFRQIFITVVIVLLLFSVMAYGDTWSTNKRLTNSTYDSVYPSIAVDGQNIYIVWHEYVIEGIDIFFKKSTDGGNTWSTNKRLTNNEGISYYPSIAVDGENVYVVWGDNELGNLEIFLKKSTDGGNTWSTNKRLTWNAGNSYGAKLSVDGSNIYIVWFDDSPGNFEIFFRKSINGGNTWTTSKRLTNNAGSSDSPSIAVNGSNIYVAWDDDTPGNFEIFFRQSADGGNTWMTKKRLTENEGDSFVPSIAVGGTNIYAVWYDDTLGKPEIFFKKSINGGNTWMTEKRLTNNDGSSKTNQSMALDGQNIYVVWNDDTPGNREIFFKKSTDGGNAWSPSKRLTWNTGESYFPSIAVDGSNIYVLWNDTTPGNHEIYFKKGILF